MGKYKYQEYALYKGDEFICLGTAKEIAEKVNITPKTVQRMSTPAYKKEFCLDQLMKMQKLLLN